MMGNCTMVRATMAMHLDWLGPSPAWRRKHFEMLQCRSSVGWEAITVVQKHHGSDKFHKRSSSLYACTPSHVSQLKRTWLPKHKGGCSYRKRGHGPRLFAHKLYSINLSLTEPTASACCTSIPYPTCTSLTGNNSQCKKIWYSGQSERNNLSWAENSFRI